MTKKPTIFFHKNSLKLTLIAVLTALLCIAISPVLATVPNLAPQNNRQENTTRNLLQTAQNLQAAGLYLRACGTLLQALDRPNLNCKTLINDQISEQVKDIFPILPTSPLRATTLRKLGDVLRMLGALNTSEKVLEQSLDIGNSLSLNAEIDAAYLSLGNTKLALGKRAQNFTEIPARDRYYQEALDYYQRAITASNSDSIQLRAKLNQLRLLIETNSGQNVNPLWQEIKSQIEKLPENLETVYAQIDFAQSLTCLNLKQTEFNSFPQPPIANLCRLETATAKSFDNSATPQWDYIGQLLGKAAQQAEKLGDMRSQSYALGNLGEIYEITQQLPYAEQLTQKALAIAQSREFKEISYRLQWQMGRLSLKTNKEKKEAIATASRASAIAAYTAAVNSLQLLRQDLTILNPDIQFNFRDEVEPIYRQLVNLLLESNPSQTNLIQARQAIEYLQLAELDNFFRDACANAKPEQIDEIINISDSTAAAIYPIILPQKLAVIIKLPKKELLYYETIQNQSEVESILKELLQELKESHASPKGKALSKQLYTWLIQPAEVELQKTGVKTLVFVMDGLLRNIPMAALYDGKEYLIKRYGVTLAPGLQLLRSKPLSREKLKVLGVGVSLEQTVDGKVLSPIENVKTELEQLKQKLPTSQILLNQNFTQTNFQSQLNSTPFSVVHMATHGEFSSNPERTYVVAWGKRLKVADLDNLLRTSSQRKSQDVELLILSACETATGDNRATLGIAGVAVRAGARSTLATLWRAGDFSSTEIVNEFYEQLVKNPNISKTEALRQAQIKLIEAKESISPYEWAPYILVGNWQ